MVGPNSTEYRRSFKEADLRCSSAMYETNLDYRQERRYKEHHHNSDIYSWDDDSLSSVPCENLPRPQSAPLHKQKHQQLINQYVKRLSKTPDNEAGQKNGYTLSHSCITSDKEQQTGEYPGNQICRSVQVTSNGTSSRRQKKPSPIVLYSQKKLAPKAKTFPAEVVRPLKSEKSPFVPYGCEDRELTTGSKRTHNVRASADVHTSALRAAQRRRAEVESMSRASLNTSDNHRNKKAIVNSFNEWMKKETNAWDTEYRKHFVGYDPVTYSRVLSARMNPGKHWAGERLIASS